MDNPNRPEYQRAQLYTQDRRYTIVARLGFGLDGVVLQTDRQSAIKSFERERSYRMERDVYLRLRERQIVQISGHAVPQMLDHDDKLRVIEMSIVQPPYILDFAKSQLDFPPDFPDHVMSERYAHWAELFEDRWPEVVAIMRELEKRCGIYLFDPNPRNITFSPDQTELD